MPMPMEMRKPMQLDLEKTYAVKPGDPFYIENGETTENSAVSFRKQDSLAWVNFKQKAESLVEDISFENKVHYEVYKHNGNDLVSFMQEVFEKGTGVQQVFLQNELKKLSKCGTERMFRCISNYDFEKEQQQIFIRKEIIRARSWVIQQEWQKNK